MSARRRNLVIFVVVTLLSGWFGVGLNGLLGQANSMESPGTALWLTLPLLTTIVLRFAGTGWRSGGWRPKLPSALPWYGLALIVFPVVTAAALSIGRIFGWANFSNFDTRGLLVAFASVFIANVVKNFFEESVWRGYLTEEILHNRPSDLRLYLAVGAVWSFWHLPYYLCFLSETEIRSVIDLPRLAAASVFFLTIFGWTVLFSEVYRLSGTIWACVLLHTVEDCLVNPLLLDGHVQLSTVGTVLVSPVSGLITTTMYVAVGLWLRSIRLKREALGVANLSQDSANTVSS